VNTRRIGLGVAVAALLTAGAAFAVQTSERLYINYSGMLPGWTVVPTLRGGNVELTEIVPPGQDRQNWVDQVAVNIVYGPPQQGPVELLADRFRAIQAECDETSFGPVSPSIENGYETALRAVACTKVKKWNQGEVSLYKAWKGKDGMYLVARSWRGAPFAKGKVPVPPETTLKWLAFIQSVTLCDTADPKKPCPAVAAKPPAVDAAPSAQPQKK
jgi:hypothetical protein